MGIYENDGKTQEVWEDTITMVRYEKDIKVKDLIYNRG